MSGQDDYTCHVQIINSSSHTLQLDAESKNKFGQGWTSEPQNTIDAGTSEDPTDSSWAVLAPNTTAQGAGGYITYSVEDNGEDLTFYFSNPMLGDNKASFDANGVNVSFVTKAGDGSWSDPGTVQQGSGAFYVKFTLS